MSWTPRSQRLGHRDLDGPYPGVPQHLIGPLSDWVRSNLFDDTYLFWRNTTMAALSMRLRIAQGTGAEGYQLFQTLMTAGYADPDVFLDIIEGALVASPDPSTSADQLRALLKVGGSTMTVAQSNDYLVDVVEQTAATVMENAIAVADEATDELQQAWKHAYGRSPDASDAWDHGIKALESVLVPIVEPNNTKATLGSVIATLQGASHKWQTVFPGPDLDNNVTNLVGALRLAWPNPDRHAGGKVQKPGLEEARAVVGLTACVVQAHREGWVVKAR